MKTLLFLTLGLFLASCGDSNSNKSNGDILNRYQDALEAQKPGFVLAVSHGGMEHDIEFDDETRLFSVNKAPFNATEREVILKVQGDNIYKYVESTYEEFEQRSVVLESISLEARRTQEMMKLIKFTERGNRLIGTLTMEGFETEYDNGDVRATIDGGRTTFAISLSRDNILCDYSSIATSSGQTFKSPNLVQKLDTVSTKTNGTCPDRMSISAVKKIDLTNIEFCDRTKEDEYDCESDMDMSHITADL